MAGYSGFSMSNNAVIAYRNGEKPLSKWTKQEILDNCGDKAILLNKLTLMELRDLLLYWCSWHHTSKKYNKTNFYAFDFDKLEDINEEYINNLIKLRVKRKRKLKKVDKFITAEIKYTIWVGNFRNYKTPKEIIEVVTFKDGDKIIKTSNGNKRLSSVIILKEL